MSSMLIRSGAGQSSKFRYRTLHCWLQQRWFASAAVVDDRRVKLVCYMSQPGEEEVGLRRGQGSAGSTCPSPSRRVEAKAC